MTGKKPSNVIVREFRGQRLFLASLHPGKGSRFVADRAQAMLMTDAESVAVCERVSRAVGVKCAVLGVGDTVRQINEPTPALPVFNLYWSPEGKKIATVSACNARAAVRMAPKPYSKYLGEVYAELVQS